MFGPTQIHLQKMCVFTYRSVCACERERQRGRERKKRSLLGVGM